MSNTDGFGGQTPTIGGLAPATPLPAGNGAARPGRYTKLQICNQALINTANNIAVSEDDNSDEWRVASSAFDQWLEIRMDERTWNWSTVLSAPLNRLGDSNYPGFADIFAKPNDCLFLANIWRADLASLIQPAWLGIPSRQYDALPPALDYRIIGDTIHTTATDAVASAAAASAPSTGDFQRPTQGDPNEFLPDFEGGGAVPDLSGPGGETSIVALYVPWPSAGQPWSVGFVASLRYAIEATILSALNQDDTAAMARMKMSEQALERAISRDSQQEPRRIALRSRTLERRRAGRYGEWLG